MKSPLINQEIYKKYKNNITKMKKYINKSILTQKYDTKMYLPKEKTFFRKNINHLKALIKNNIDYLIALNAYKSNSFIQINYVLRNKQFSNSININELLKTLEINVEKTILFDLLQITNKLITINKEYINKYNSFIISKILNIDDILNKSFILDDCYLFRGTNIEKKNKMKKEIKYDSYLSTSFNLATALNFIYTSNDEQNILYIIKIKKIDKIPYIYLSDAFFKQINKTNNQTKYLNKYNKIEEREYEILLPRNISFKINNVSVLNKESLKSINNVYKKKKYKLTVIFLESMPYKFIPLNMNEYKLQSQCYINI